jgi:branched-chain amino acid transport system ATP-binding protein
MSLLEVRALSAGYGPVEVLHGRAVSGMIGRSGSVTFDGVDITRTNAEKLVGMGIAHVPQGRGTFPDLTVMDNLRVGAYARSGGIAADIDRWFAVFPRLAERRDQRAGSLSGGEQQMLAIARALMSHPKLLLCDEPSLGLAPLITQEVFEVLKKLNADEGLSVLLVEQNANLALKVAQRVYLLETGTVVASGSAAQIASDDTIRKAYLGA